MWSAETSGLANKYFEFVKYALTDQFVWDNFKCNLDYISIVGTPTPERIEHFLKKIKEYPEIVAKMDEFRANDTYGHPPYIYPDWNVSMGTLRYIHSLCDLKKQFGTLDNMTIAEMGVGYGGLAFVISTYFKPKAYHLIDLPDVQKLSMKYLELLKISATTEPPPEEVDLFISEFCLSEFDDEDLYKFYDMYVAKAHNAYLQMNLIDEDRKQRFIKRMNEDFGLEIYPEDHGTGFPAYVIVGKKEWS